MPSLVDPDARLVIAHRGASADAPENTLPAFALAVERGADALELDVRVTADGVAVVLHDATLDRTTDGVGPVALQPLAAVRRLDAGARFSRDGGRTFPYRGRGIGVPTLAEVLAAFPAIPILVEVKEPAAQAATAAAILGAGAERRCVMASEQHDALEAFRTAPFLVGASARDIGELWRAVVLRRRRAPVSYRLLSVPLRHRGLPVPTRGFIAAARRLGAAVHVWTVDDPAVALRLWERGVAGIVTNRPEAMRAARAASVAR